MQTKAIEYIPWSTPDDVWIDLRKKGIGGSDVPAIMGESKFATKTDIYNQKTNSEFARPANYDDEYLQAGRFLEPGIARWLSETINTELYFPDFRTYKDREYDFLFCSPDRLFLNNTNLFPESHRGLLGVVEIKNTSAMYTQVTRAWYCQLQYNMYVMGAGVGICAWCSKGHKLTYNAFVADLEFQQSIIDAISQFWHENVLMGITPQPDTSLEVSRYILEELSGESVQATDSNIRDLLRYQELSEEIKAKQLEKEDLAHKIKLFIIPHSELKLGNKRLAKVSKDKRGSIRLYVY